MVDHIAVRRARDNQFYWLLVARNGEVLSVSETYTRRSSALRSARRLARGLFVSVIDESR